jgi:concentrative nucleoside transporter, CNT family
VSIAFLGVLAIPLIAVVFSENRRAIRLRVVLTAFALQAGIAVFVLYTQVGQTVLKNAAIGVQAVIQYANAGIDFVFGPLANADGVGFVFAIKVLAVIVFVSSLMSVLYHLRIMQMIVFVIGGALQRIIGTGRIESLCAAANIFVGPIEAPLAVRPYLPGLSRSQLFAVMAAGLSSVAGAVLLGYINLGIDAQYLIAAAFMAAPGGLLMAKILVPDDPQEAKTKEKIDLFKAADEGRAVNVIEAAADGATAGMKLALQIGAMLIAFIALVAMLNGLFSWVGGWFGMPELTLEYVLGLIFSPLMLLLGVPWEEAIVAGNLVGQKTILNEFIAFVKLAEIQGGLSEHTRAVTTIALCGFANLNALAIVLGGLGGLIPERKREIARLGLRAVLAGTLSNLMSAAMAGALFALQ